MYKPVQKKSSSWTPTSIQNKSKSLSKPGTFSVQPKSESKSSQQQQIPDYSSRAAEALAANVMRSLETPQQAQEEAHSVQRQIEPGAAFVVDGIRPIAQSPTFSIQSKEVGIQRQCSECAKEQQQESAEEGKDVDEMSVWASAIQTKLTVGAAGDKYEQEADRVAAQVMSMSVAPDASPQVQRFGEESNPVQKWSLAQSITPVAQRQVDEQVQLREIVQRAFQPGGTQASGDLESRLNASKGGGSALAPEVRAFMEPRFGADFSSVRVHTGSEAVQMNRELGAQAFAHGSDVYFGAGKSPGNNELTAHELTHVVQQTGGVQTKLNFQRAESFLQRLTAEEKKLNLKSPRFAGNSRLESAYDNSPAMRKAEQGDAVKLVQQALIDDGFEMPISTRKTGEADGIFGDETYNTVLQFQIKHQLGKDGVVGRKTLGKLDELSSASPTSPETSTQELPPCPINMQPDTDERTLISTSFVLASTNSAILPMPGINCQIQAVKPPATVTAKAKLEPIRKNAKACLVHLHGDEINALEVAKSLYKNKCTNLTYIENPGNRLIDINVPTEPKKTICHADPNRIFDDAAIGSQWQLWNKGSCLDNNSIKNAAQDAVKKYRDTELLPNINQCRNNSSSPREVKEEVGKQKDNKLPVVAFHNNSPGKPLSIHSYSQGGSEEKATEKDKTKTLNRDNPHIVKGQDPDNFMLVTEPKDFEALAQKGRNVVLQTKNPPNDGSLSVFLREGEYINVEAQQTKTAKPISKELTENKNMGSDALDALNVHGPC